MSAGDSKDAAGGPPKRARVEVKLLVSLDKPGDEKKGVTAKLTAAFMISKKLDHDTLRVILSFSTFKEIRQVLQTTKDSYAMLVDVQSCCLAGFDRGFGAQAALGLTHFFFSLQPAQRKASVCWSKATVLCI